MVGLVLSTSAISKRDYKEIKSIRQSLDSGLPSIVRQKNDNPAMLSGKIELMLLELAQYAGQKFTEFQLKECARMIIEQCYYMNLSDLNLAFNKIRIGEVKIFGAINPMVVFEAINIYTEERSREGEMVSRKKALEFEVKEINSPEIDLLIKNFVTEMRNKELAARSKHQIESDEEFPEQEYAYKVRALVNEFYLTHPRESTAKELTDYVTEKLNLK